MMDSESANVAVSVAAMKLLLGRLYTLVYTFANLKEDDVLAAHKTLRATLHLQSLVKSNDPAVSDVMSDEVAHEIDQFLLGVQKDFAKAKRAR